MTYKVKYKDPIQLTLTCISTASPVYRISWTKDSEKLSGTMTSKVTDSNAAKFTHTFTVTGQLIRGLYKCTVSNFYYSASTSISIEGNNYYPACMRSRGKVIGLYMYVCRRHCRCRHENRQISKSTRLCVICS